MPDRSLADCRRSRGKEQRQLPRLRRHKPGTDFARCVGCPSTTTKIGVRALTSSRLRKSLNTAAVTRPFVNMKRS
jgi:hypothetical protein